MESIKSYMRVKLRPQPQQKKRAHLQIKRTFDKLGAVFEHVLVPSIVVGFVVEALSASVSLFASVIVGAQNFFGLALKATSLLRLVPSVKANSRTHRSRVCDKAVSKTNFLLRRLR